MTEAAFLARTWPTRGEPDLILRLVPDRSASVRHWRRTCPQVFVLVDLPSQARNRHVPLSNRWKLSAGALVVRWSVAPHSRPRAVIP